MDDRGLATEYACSGERRPLPSYGRGLACTKHPTTHDEFTHPSDGKNQVCSYRSSGEADVTGPIWHETLLSRRIQPVAEELGLPHITWRLLRHWGATQMVEARVPLKAAQELLGHSRPDILLKFYAHVLDGSADAAAEVLSVQLGGGFFSAKAAQTAAV